MSGSTLCFIMAGVFMLCGLGSKDDMLMPLGFLFGGACVFIGVLAFLTGS